MTGGATDLVRLPGSEGPVDSAIVKFFFLKMILRP